MRIVCPNCGAEYEVDNSAIPPGGRDVQCGSCSISWFQAPAEPLALEEPVSRPGFRDPAVEKAIEEAEIDRDLQSAWQTSQDRASNAAQPDKTPRFMEQADVQPDRTAETGRFEFDGDTVPDADKTVFDWSESTDMGAAEVSRMHTALRKERSEVQQQVEEGSKEDLQRRLGMQSEPEPEDMPDAEAGKDDIMSKVREEIARDSVVYPKEAPSRGRSANVVRGAAEAGILTESMKQKLPGAMDEEDAAAADLRKRETGSSFGRGFLVAVFLAVLAFLAYVMRDQLGDALPQARSALDSYAAVIDRAREQVSEWFQIARDRASSQNGS